ncbi:hypothetical protein FZ103_15385 [Streptomonospora sp. PA3]|uniref:hypothetical protein n=1 Tax=Streptomonospora sp. PA3 TaxID=2607326 RepID=UPI0012DDDDE7|nr:hypothetical protein [Streptomonospora sp. PA3]MUL42538.1 hypothetical protein [Streptomonospora sp. PA3]
MPRWIFFFVGILALVYAGMTTIDTVQMLNSGIEEGMGVFYGFIAFFVVFGAVFIAIGVKKRN